MVLRLDMLYFRLMARGMLLASPAIRVALTALVG